MANIIKRIWNQNKMVNIEALQGMAFQAEDGGHTFEISGVDDEGNAVPLSGTVAGAFMRPDKADIALVGTASDGVVSVTLSDACYAVTGKFGLTIFVTDGNNKKTAVYAAVGTVVSTTGGAVAGDTPQDVVDLINAIEAAVATIPASYTDMMAAIAPTYSSSALYAVGSYAWYDGELYRCTTAITTAESWTAAHWTAAVLANDVYNISEATRNLWLWGDQNVTGVKAVTDNANLPAGTYTMSAKVVKNESGNVRMVFYKNSVASGNILANPYIVANSRNSVTFTLAEKADLIRVYSAANSTGSIPATWQDVQIEVGSTATNYVPPMTAVDYVARAGISNTIVENQTYSGGSQSITITLPGNNVSAQTPVISCDAMFTRSSGVTDYPRIRFEMNNARGLSRNSTWYKVGEESVYEIREWRAPAFSIWQNNTVRLVLNVPTGCTLTIRKLWYRFDSSIDHSPAGGIRFFARPGTCNMVEELTVPAIQMALRHGYDTFTVIPKVSSDGVWFAYHDDTWDISTTDLTNPDGTAITNTAYNGDYFHEIPFSYLEQYKYTKYGSMFADLGLMKLDTCLAFLAKTGMKLRFSMHPATGINTIAKLTELKRLVQKYGLLKDLTIIVNDITSLFPVFKNDIGGYCFGNSTEASWTGETNRVDKALTDATAAKSTYGITVPISCGLWSDSLFSDHENAEQLVSDILDEGFTAEVFSYTLTGIDGSTHSYLWSEDFRWAMSIGCTGFTDGYNTSIGLNW